MPIALFASLTAQPEQRAALEQALRQMVEASRREPGNLRYDLFVRGDDAATFDLFELYADEAAVAAHRGSAHYQAFRALIGDWLAAPVEVRSAAALDLAPFNS
ncbi:antibiotic biosynthesis monooxygenase [Pseudomonas sp. L-22-4S-12]|uniref:putative quinol monooxygenase n=1 Tax=Pseudomonas sp. L-22-4S-12 TaxID=2610893 RepID=UPI00132915A1|nr:putative quinol monooxygenase [Pseudomonas sp. L-22-4S-12]MWV17156.1 antibiotic biosynthesis monooxygenase [Pseudomonas sp. L-22-4S-12]